MKSENISVDAIAFRIFGDFFTKREAKFESLRETLMKARLYMPVEKWLSKAAFYAVIAVPCAISAYILFRVIFSMIVDLGPFGVKDAVFIVFGGLISFCLTFFFFYSYPKIKAWERRGRIDKNLAYSISYVSAMASIGVIPYMIFKKLSEAEETYGEVSTEVKLIVRDVELLGFDFMTALKRLVTVTPSADMRAFLQGSITTALSGGEMGNYFINAAKEYMADRRIRYDSFIETLGLFAEFYVIGMVVAPLLIVVVLTIMCFLGNASLDSLAAIVYFIIPAGSAGFIVLVGMIGTD